MLNKFQAYLIERGFKEFSMNGSRSTAWDYPYRISKIIAAEGISLEKLSAGIAKYLELYGPKGEKWTTGRRSHHSYFQALRHFRKFMLVQRFGGVNA